jgi:folate-binding protein YgfZ
MTPPAPAPRVLIRRTDAAVRDLREQATMVRTAPALFRIEGPGAVDCVQGLLTNDVVRSGPDSVIYGALLTNKGMIVVDYWVLRDGGGLTLVADPGGRAASFDLFTRQLPPRLARFTDRTGALETLWLLGAGSEKAVAAAGLPWPGPGRLNHEPGIPGPVVVARPDHHAPWQAVIAAPRETLDALQVRLAEAGARLGSPDDLEASRILSGWPRLGVEIEDKTLPQEVRYDEIGGVSYTKGCYTGQETVARIHFRGRPNWFLRGVVGSGTVPAGAEIRAGERPSGQLTSVLQLDTGWLGIGRLRREIEPGATVAVGSDSATVVTLPFATP